MSSYTLCLGEAKKALYKYFKEKKTSAPKANEIEISFFKGFERGWIAAKGDPNNPARDADVVRQLETGMPNPGNFGFAVGFIFYALAENLRLILEKTGTYTLLMHQIKKERIFHLVISEYKSAQSKSVKVAMTAQEKRLFDRIFS